MVDKLTYLGSTLSRVVYIDDDGNARIAKASAALCRLAGNIWFRNGIRPDTKLKVYISVVLSTLLYICGTRTVYRRHAKRLNHFHTSCLRKLLKIKWQERIPNTGPEKGRYAECTHSEIGTVKIDTSCYRMPDESLPKTIL